MPGAAYSAGRIAGLEGRPSSACRFRLPEKIEEWNAGWQSGDRERLQLEDQFPRPASSRDPGAQARGRDALDGLMEMLK